jgi:tetratricopeptide (TPR) repeat protein
MQFQFSKQLHPFLKVRGALADYDGLLRRSLHHARKGVINSTNQESGWSHLAVVHLARNDLRSAKAALARSIELDPFYYDNHRMMALLELQDGNLDAAVTEMGKSLDITERSHQVNTRRAANALVRAVQAKDDAAIEKARRRLWSWIKRSRVDIDFPMFVFEWEKTDRLREVFLRATDALRKGDAAAADAAIAVIETTKGVEAYPPFWVRLLRGFFHVLHGQEIQAEDLLPRLPGWAVYPDPITAVAQISLGLGAAESDVKRLLSLSGAQAQRDPRQVERTWVEVVGRASVQLELYFKYLAYSILFAYEDQRSGSGGTDPRELARVGVELVHRIMVRGKTDFFPVSFRTAYGQVVAAYEQVERVASRDGRIEQAAQLISQRKPDRALELIDGALRRFKEPYPAAHLYRGMALEALGRVAEARPEYERFLQQAPDSPQAEKVRARLQQIPTQ